MTTTLHNENRTASITKIEHKDGETWEIATFPKGCNPKNRIFKTQIHVFNNVFEFVEFIAFHNFK